MFVSSRLMIAEIRTGLGFIVILPAIVFAMAGGLGCEMGAPRQPDILLVTVDTLRPDHLGIFGYERPTSPRIDEFFADGAIFERAYSVEANTPPSVLTILSGLPPRSHGVRGFYELLKKDVALIPDRLPEAYQTAAFVSNIVLTNEAIGIADRFDHYDDYVDEAESARPNIYERSAARTTDAALAWLEQEREDGRPLFLWVHYIDPHGPYSAPAESLRGFTHEGWEEPGGRRRVRKYQFDPTVTDGLTYVDRYDEEIAYTDAQVGRLLDGYGATASLEDAFVLFTADHGESMMEHGIWFTHGYHVWEEIMRVPLLLRGPGVASGRRTELSSGLDIAPTILAAAGLTTPLRDDVLGRGFDLRSKTIPSDRVIYAEASLDTHRWRAGWRGNDKWMFSNKGAVIMPQIHFDLENDPDEEGRRPWFATPPPDAILELIKTDPIIGDTKRGRTGSQLDAPKIDSRVSDAQRRQLEALGYGGGESVD
jgi:arylsulfatase